MNIEMTTVRNTNEYALKFSNVGKVVRIGKRHVELHPISDSRKEDEQLRRMVAETPTEGEAQVSQAEEEASC